MSAQIFGLDYDGTFTADPDLWRQFISAAQARGHTVVCVTARRTPPDYSREPRMPDSVSIVCAGQVWKKHAAAKAGYPVNVWIDDIPGLIEPTRVLDVGGSANG